jgi:hypothetical protein
MNHDTLSRIAQRYGFEGFTNVLSVRVTDVRAAFFQRTSVYKVSGRVSAGFSDARVTPAGVPIEVVISRDGRAVGFQGWPPPETHGRGKIARAPRKR